MSCHLPANRAVPETSAGQPQERRDSSQLRSEPPNPDRVHQQKDDLASGDGAAAAQVTTEVEVDGPQETFTFSMDLRQVSERSSHSGLGLTECWSATADLEPAASVGRQWCGYQPFRQKLR